MLSDIRINGSASEAVIDIEGVIGVPEQTQFLQPGGRVATYARFAEALAAVAAVQAPRVVVNIRSAMAASSSLMCIILLPQSDN